MAAGDLTTKADVKIWLNITGTESDTLIDRLITAYSAVMQRWMSRTIASTAYTEKYNGSGTPSQFLRQGPVTAVASLTVNGVAIPAAPDSSSYGFLFDDERLYLNAAVLAVWPCPVAAGFFPRGPQNVTVTYTAGYASTPPELAQACIDWVAYSMRQRLRIGKHSENLASQTETYITDAIPEWVKITLQQFKRVVPA